MEKRYIFVLQMEDGEIFAGRKHDVDNEIRKSEEKGYDLGFKTIGKITEPPQGLPMDFNGRLIEWFNDTTVTPSLINDGVMAIVKFLNNRSYKL